MNKKFTTAFSSLMIAVGLVGTINYYAMYKDEKVQKDDVQSELIAVVQTNDEISTQLAKAKKNLATQQSTNAELKNNLTKQNQQSQAQLKIKQAQINKLNIELEQARKK